MSFANVAQGNAFYISVRDIVIVINTGTGPDHKPAVVPAVALKADGTAAALNPKWTTTSPGTAADNSTYVAAGAAVFRDLGKSIVIPGNAATGVLQQVLRKVELIDTSTLAQTQLNNGVAPNSFVGFNEGSGPIANNVCYIAVKPNATNEVFFAKLGL